MIRLSHQRSAPRRQTMMMNTLFLAAGLAALGAAAALALGPRHDRRRRGLAALLWACFGAGLVVPSQAPNLKVERGAFVIPAPTRPGAVLDPGGTIEREKHMQLLALFLTAGAALGLARHYRSLFVAGSSAPAVSE